MDLPGKRIRKWREHLQLSGKQFETATGIPYSTLKTLENNEDPDKVKPSFDVLTKVLQTYGQLNPDWLLLGTGPMLRDGRALTSATPAPAVAQEPEAPKLTSGMETISHATEIVLREVLLDRVAGLKEEVARLLEQNKELRDENKLLLGKPFDSPDAADESKEDEPTNPAPTTGVLPLPTLRVQTVRGLRPTACKD